MLRLGNSNSSAIDNVKSPLPKSCRLFLYNLLSLFHCIYRKKADTSPLLCRVPPWVSRNNVQNGCYEIHALHLLMQNGCYEIHTLHLL